MAFADVSEYQGLPDFNTYARHYKIIVIKASEGLTFNDPHFARNWHRAGDAKLIRGAYHFARPQPGRSAHDEARHFHRVVEAAGGRRHYRDLPYILDLEWTRLGMSATYEWASVFCETIHTLTGRSSIGYLPNWFWGSLPLPRKCKWEWPASYPNLIIPPNIPRKAVIAHQFTDRASVPGIAGGCDLSHSFLSKNRRRRLCI